MWIEESLNRAKAHLQELMSMDPRPLCDLIYYDNIEDKIKQIKEEITPIQAEMQDLVDTGKAFTIGGDREEISNKAKELARAKAELRMLITKQDELGAKSTKVSDGLKKIGNASRNAFQTMHRSANKAFSTVNRGARQSSGALTTFLGRIKGLAASAFLFNLISKGFNAMVSSMRTGFTNLMGYSNGFANSIQSVKNSLSTLGNQIAAAFAPIIQAVIPWLNQLISMIVTAMSYVSQFIAALTGRSTYLRAKKVQDSFNSSLGDTSSKADDAADSMDNMADSAKKARGALAAFDDLDVLEKQDDSAADKIKDLDNAIKDLGSGAGGGVGDLFEEVPIEDNILDAVERLMEILAQLFAPLKEAWEHEGKFVIDAWKFALEEIWQLLKDIGRDFLTVWNQEKTIQMLSNVLHVIGDIGLVIGNIAGALDEAWNKNNTGLHILENIRDIFAAIVQNIREAADFTVEWSEKLNFSPLLESIERLTKELVPFADFVSGTLADFYTQFILPLTSWVLSEEGLPRLINILGDFMDAVDWEALRTALKNLYIALEPYAEAIGEGLIDFIEKLKDIGVNILNAIPEPIQKLADALNSGDPETVREWATGIIELSVAIKALKLAFEGFEIIKAGLAALGAGGAASGMSEAGAAMGETTKATGGLSGAIGGLAAKFQSGLLGMGAFGLGLEFLKKSSSDQTIANAMADTMVVLQSLKQQFDDGVIGMEEYEAQRNRLTETMSKAIANRTDESLEELKRALDETVEKFNLTGQAADEFSGKMVEAGKNIGEGVVNGFKQVDFITAVQGVYDGVTESMASVFDMHSPARRMEPFGENIFLGVLNGFKAAFTYFTDAITTFWESYIVPWFAPERWQELGENIKFAFVEKWTEIQEWFSEFWTIFTETLFEIWENIILFFTEAWENITLIFQTFIDFINDMVIPIWQSAWITAQSIFQTFRDFVNNVVILIKTLFTEFFQKFVKNIIDVNWKTAWENAKNIFEAFKGKVSNVIDTIRGIIQSFFDWVMGIIQEVLGAIESIGNAVAGIFNGGIGGGSAGGGGGASFSMARTAAYSMDDFPHLASGAVIRGGNPYMAVLGDQPRGQTNVETPLDTIKQAVREEMSGMNFGTGNINADMTLDGETFARLLVPYILDEMGRQGLDVDILGVT